ncbi:non-heme iron oxygenase ferredoxin subunit [Agrococcus jejuensis]|uniref:3-phenylpropionate/trans-cinnamate dioxygenase ferredoxin subunit n=1 Tax=Agrococcus jejuensis TaxID=399736 RepID=A0A1G8HAL8_9MICO|nr:non-heme iron oxygenase ferredoxin subunit [Agrococcus jejuensis]SDI03687.1 3-phenylpropionate/trans-cinnamate dioxygenase ferredoxin subunit [Agrococcus jejuensis]
MTATRACSASEISTSEPRKVEIDGIAVSIVRDSAGQIHALGDRCTHGDISLSEGFVENDTLECWAHGSQFSLHTGRPLNLPAYEPVPVYPVTIDGDDVLVDVTNPIDVSGLMADGKELT